MVILYILMPLLVSTAIGFTVTTLAQTYLPALADNITLLTGISGLLTIPVMVYLARRDIGQSMLADAGQQHTFAHTFWQRQSLVRKVLLLMVAGLLGAGCSLLEGWLMRISGVSGSAAYAPVGAFFQAKVWMQMIFLGIVTPIAEELTFRGELTRRLCRFISPKAAIIVAALLFAIGHGNLVQALYALPMGLLLGAAGVYGGSLPLPIAIHIGANMIAVLVGALA